MTARALVATWCLCSGIAIAGVRGVVVDERGIPIAGANVIMTFPSLVLTATSAPDGTFSTEDSSVAGLAWNEIRATATGYSALVAHGAPADRGRYVLVSTASIRGTLVDAATGKGVERGEIRVFAEDPCGGLLAGESTDPEISVEADGTFEVRNLERGLAFTVRGMAPGYVPTLLAAIEPGTGTELPIALSRGASIRGLVTTPDGAPARGARVSDATRVTMWDTERGSAVTSADGSFRLDGLPSGRTDLLIEQEGFESLEASIDLGGNEVATRSFRLARGTLRRTTVQVSPTVTLRGVVIRAGARVTGGRVREQVMSDALPEGSPIGPDGTFELPGLLPGIREIVIEPADGPYELETVILPDRDTTLTFELPSGIVRGHVLESGNPIGGIDVKVSPGGHGAQSRDDGSFEIVGVPPGAYALLAERHGDCGPSGQPRACQQITVAEDAVVDVRVDMPPIVAALARLTGRVELAGGGTAFPVIVAIRDVHGEDVAEASTDGAGRYCITRFAEGIYDVVLNEGVNFYALRVRGYATVVRRGVAIGDASRLDLTLAPGARLKVTVCDGASPLEGAWVETLPPIGLPEKTGADGCATLRDLPAGGIVVRVRVGDATREIPVDLAGATTEIVTSRP
ncbi:MAG: carboxypeptidase-like regulatory domain-containing protein [Acidobacteriota bacterium]